MKNIVDFIRGVFIGIACAVPGVPNSSFKGKFNNSRKNFIFMPVVLGCAVGILLMSKVIMWVCGYYIGPAYAFFIGLILGSIPMLVDKIKRSGFEPVYLIFTAFFTALIIFMTIISNNYPVVSPDFILIKSISSVKDAVLIFAGGVFFCSLPIMPGVSGSALLLGLNHFGSVFYAFSNIFEEPACVPIIILFVSGALTGFLFVLRFVEWAMKNHLKITYYCSVGLLSGCVLSLFYNGIVNAYVGGNVPNIIAQTLIFSGFTVLGFFIMNRIKK